MFAVVTPDSAGNGSASVSAFITKGVLDLVVNKEVNP